MSHPPQSACRAVSPLTVHAPPKHGASFPIKVFAVSTDTLFTRFVLVLFNKEIIAVRIEICQVIAVSNFHQNGLKIVGYHL